MNFSRSVEYGLRAVLYLATNCSEGLRFGVKTIAKDLDVPEHFLGKVLQNLVRKGIIFSVKGPNGGFYINKSKIDLPIINIIEAPIFRKLSAIKSTPACLLHLLSSHFNKKKFY